MTKFVLDMSEMQDNFFADAAMIGIVSAVPAYRLCWMLNNHFDIDLARDPEQNVMMKKKDISYCFPIYQYNLPNSCYQYLLYKLKNGKETLLPEIKQIDYLWLLRTSDPDEDAARISGELRNIRDVQLAQVLAAEQLKNLPNLLV